MSKRLLIFFGIGLVAVAIAVVVILSANKGSHLELQGKILKVRTGALGERNSIAVMDFRVLNPSDLPFTVRNVEISLEKASGEMEDGATISKSDLKQLFQYNRFLGATTCTTPSATWTLISTDRGSEVQSMANGVENASRNAVSRSSSIGPRMLVLCGSVSFAPGSSVISRPSL